MAFLTPALLAGAALIALPIVLHLVMRRQPKQLMFPALRFVQSRRQTNQHRLQFRHLLLLLLRCGLIALLALALARPVFKGQGLLGGDSGVLSTALVFDTSPRMGYFHGNRTRLQAAQELANWFLTQLPLDSQAVVLDNGTSYRSAWGDRDLALLRVERLGTQPAAGSLTEAIRQGFGLLKEREGDRRELYVFTDLGSSTWSAEGMQSIQEEMKTYPDVQLYLVDVGIEKPQNASLTNVQLSSISPAAGQPLHIKAELTRETADGEAEKTVELWLDEGTGAQKRGEIIVPVTQQEIDFAVAGLAQGLHQGYIRIVGTDPLAVDDARYFTLDIRAGRRILLVTDQPAGDVFLREAIAPAALGDSAANKFNCETISIRDLAQTSLDEFAAICLLDPGPLSGDAWSRLDNFVRQGGGLGLFLGNRADITTFNESPAQQLLPGPLRWRAKDDTYFRPDRYQHPALAELADLADALPWANFPVFKYWEFEKLNDQSLVIARYANGAAALIERTMPPGKVLVMTTPVSDPASGAPWNLLPTGPDPWPFLALSNSLVDYLSGGRTQDLNFMAGQTALLPLSPQERVASYVLKLPTGESLRQMLSPGQEEIATSATDTLGNYRVIAGGESGGLDRGFSVNVPDDASRLERARFEEIQAALGADRVRLARSSDEIEIHVGIGRIGQELFPWLITIVAVILGAEHWLSNRFYQQD